MPEEIPTPRFWMSRIALGVLHNAAVLLAFDLVAERRGAAYLAAIQAQASRAASRVLRSS